MKDEGKTRKQLIEELEELRGQTHQDPFAARLAEAVERVRAKAVSMRRSEDLPSLVGLMFEEVQRLGVDVACPSVVYLDPESDQCTYYNGHQNLRQIGITWTSPDIVEYSDSIAVAVLRYTYRDWLEMEAGQRWQEKMPWPDRIFVDEETNRSTVEAYGLSGHPVEWDNREVSRANVPFENGLLILAVWGEDPRLMPVAEALTDALCLGYVRFLDLVRLEEQNRKLEVEQILERVRGQALGMQRSEDLTAVAATVFGELRALKLTVWRCGFGIFDEQCDPPEAELWSTTVEGNAVRTGGTFRIDESADSVVTDVYLAWKRGEEHYINEVGGDALRTWIGQLPEKQGVSFPEWHERREEELPERLWSNYVYFTQGYLYVPTLESVPDETLRVLKQLVAVFGVAYSRFLELRKAQEHARQAQRRAAIDRVRAEIATMRASSDLERLTPLMWKELADAGVSFYRCGIFVVAKDRPRVRAILTDPQGESLAILDLAPGTHPLTERVLESWEAQRQHSEQWDREAFVGWMDCLQEQGQYIERREYLGADEPPESLCQHFVPFAQGMLYVGSTAPLPDEDIALTQEVATAFSVAYARYLDFERLEEQNRNLEVEQALERLRTRVAGMQKSADLLNVHEVMTQEMRGLGVRLDGVGVNLVDGEAETLQVFAPGTAAKAQPIPHQEVEAARAFWTHWKEGRAYARHMTREDLIAWRQALVARGCSTAAPETTSRPEGRSIVDMPFSHGTVAMNRLGSEPFSDEDIALLERFTEIFALGYSRHLDLQAAETRAHQAELDLGVERVRSASMAMNSTADLPEVVATVFREMRRLGIDAPAAGINLVEEEAGRIDIWNVWREPTSLGLRFGRGDKIEVDEDTWCFHGNVDIGDPGRAPVVDAWRAQETTVIERPLSAEDCRQALVYLRLEGPEEAVEAWVQELSGAHPIVNVPFTYGTIGYQIRDPVEDHIDISHALAGALELGYLRYFDLQAAEERAAEAAREAAYERVRNAVLESSSSEGILRANSLLAQELRNLGVPIYAAGINIVDEEAGVWRQLSGSATTISLNEPGLTDVVAHWRRGAPFMRPAEFAPATVEAIRRREGEEAVQRLGSVRVIVDVPFSHGTLAMSSSDVDEFSETEIQILQGFGDVISLAYTRYLDKVAVEGAERQRIATLEEELQTAHDMQMHLMPTESPDLSGISVAGSCIPASSVGGDFYQYFQRGDRWTASLADVTGHSMGAAIPAVMFSGILDAKMETPTSLEDRFAGLNRSLCRSLGQHTYICMSMVDIDRTTRTMTVANCGCPYPLHYRGTRRQIEEIQIEAYPLGVRPDTEYAAREVALETGDYVVLHSDGFSEAANAKKQLFGFDRTMEVIRRACSEGLPPEDLIERLIAEVKAFTGDEPQADDMTCVVVKVEA